MALAALAGRWRGRWQAGSNHLIRPGWGARSAASSPGGGLSALATPETLSYAEVASSIWQLFQQVRHHSSCTVA